MARQIGAIVMGVWYSLIISSGFSEAIRNLSNESSVSGFGEHYVLIAVTWLAGVFIAATLAGLASRTHPIAVSMLTSAPLPALYTILLLTLGGRGLDYELAPLVFGWRPNALGFIFILCILTLAIGFLAGKVAYELAAQEELSNGTNQSRFVLGIRWGHWLWLWIPVWSWAGISAVCLYLAWLALAMGWHWVLHPSLWFIWRWILYGFFGLSFTILPFGLLIEGIENSLATLSSDTQLAISKGRVALRFVGYGFGMAVLGAILSMQVAFWILSKLPIVSEGGKPWWVLHW